MFKDRVVIRSIWHFQKYCQKKVTEKLIKIHEFHYKNVSVEKAVIILSKNGIQINENEAEIILELLYLLSKSYDKPRERKTPHR